MEEAPHGTISARPETETAVAHLTTLPEAIPIVRLRVDADKADDPQGLNSATPAEAAVAFSLSSREASGSPKRIANSR
jgi:hypothetical protein